MKQTNLSLMGNQFKLDRSAFKIIKMSDKVQGYEYWILQEPEKRISAIEFLRKQYNGTQSRLQRVYRIIKRT